MNERRGREYWSEQVAQWRCSGLSKRAYSERHGLPYSSLCRWAGKLASRRRRVSRWSNWDSLAAVRSRERRSSW